VKVYQFTPQISQTRLPVRVYGVWTAKPSQCTTNQPGELSLPKIRSCDVDRWPTTLKFSGFRVVVKVHVYAKFHRARRSGSRVIVVTEKRTPTKTILSVATVESNKKAQLTQRERATAVHVWRPTANKCKIRKNFYFSAQGHSRSLLSVSIETRVWLPISD